MSFITIALVIICYHVPSFERQVDIFMSMKKIDESLGQSNTERRVKISASVSKEGT